jgi:hypothetical protein
MGDQFYRSGRPSGHRNENKKDSVQGKSVSYDVNKKGKDDDLVIEENTIYEIDRECYERLSRQKKR